MTTTIPCFEYKCPKCGKMKYEITKDYSVYCICTYRKTGNYTRMERITDKKKGKRK